METPPPRLFVVARPENPRSIVIRRGPTKVAATYLWFRRTDHVELGQMMRARLYEHSAEISPDGKTWSYCALNGDWDNPETRGAYGVTARVPYLKALRLEPLGSTWGVHSAFYERLLRDGWTARGGAETYTRRFGGVELQLQYRDLRDHYSITVQGRRIDMPDWTWADVLDRKLVFAAMGKLWRSARIGDDGTPVEPSQIHDFTDTTFIKVAAPY